MAGDEARPPDQVSRLDRPGAEPQVRDRHRPGFLRVIDEVSLGEVGVSSPMILIEFLLAPTVPSAPSPKKTARTTSSGSMSHPSS